MKQEEVTRALEELNQEMVQLQRSKEYRFGKKYFKYKNLMMGFHFIQIFKMYRYSRIKKALRLKAKPIPYERKLDEEKTIVSKNDKIAIYYTILNGYDVVREPIFQADNIDYILFTDQPELYREDTRFIVKKIPDHIMKLENSTFINRYMKMHPKEVLKEYDYSIYVDGSLRIVSDLRRLIETITKKTGLSMHRHHIRHCIYDEARACIMINKGNKKNIKQQIEKYRREGFPENFGMLEAGMIISDLKNETAEKILAAWWDEFYKTKSMRDQLALPYILWKKGYKIDDVGFLGTDIYTNKKWQAYDHQ